MNEFLSKKFRILNFISMVAVVYTHAYNFKDNYLLPTTKISEGLNVFAFIEFFVSNGLVRFAVPLFAMISGYLLFLKWKCTIKSYFKEVVKRIRSIFIPFVIWTIISGLFCIVVSQFIFDSEIINYFSGTYKEGIVAFFNSPAAFQFWYFKDLFKLILIFPIFYFFNKTLRGIPNIVFAYMFIFNVSFYVDYKILLPFSLGSYFALNEDLRNRLLTPSKDKKLTYILCAITISLCLVYTYLSASWQIIDSLDMLRNILYKSSKILSLICVFRLYDVFEDKLNIPNFFVNNTLFIFVMHEPIQQFLAAEILKFYGPDHFKLIIFIFLPILINIVICYFGNFLKKHCPRLAFVLTGGRV